MTVAIVGIGAALPERTVPNSHFTHLDTSDEWITRRTGIKERRFMAEDGHLADLALDACRDALRSAEAVAATASFFFRRNTAKTPIFTP